MKTKESIAQAATDLISKKAPKYFVRWNPNVKAFPQDSAGMYELFGPDKNVHYRRKNIGEILSLARIEEE